MSAHAFPIFDGHNDTLLNLHVPERGGGRSFFDESPYIWWIDADEAWYHCNFCEKRASVGRSNVFSKGSGIVAPSDDPHHPWWNVPQDQSYSFYHEYWEQWPSTKGRVVF